MESNGEADRRHLFEEIPTAEEILLYLGTSEKHYVPPNIYIQARLIGFTIRNYRSMLQEEVYRVCINRTDMIALAFQQAVEKCMRLSKPDPDFVNVQKRSRRVNRTAEKIRRERE